MKNTQNYVKGETLFCIDKDKQITVNKVVYTVNFKTYLKKQV